MVALSISYGIPIAINVLHGRTKLPETRAFVLPSWFAWPANILGLIYIIVTSVLFVFPPDLPVDASSMNYCIVAVGIWLFISLLTYIFEGRKHYVGPKVEVDDQVLTAFPSPQDTRTGAGIGHSEKESEALGSCAKA